MWPVVCQYVLVNIVFVWSPSSNFSFNKHSLIFGYGLFLYIVYLERIICGCVFLVAQQN